ncbi:MAG TPA: hypothetical protein VMF32_14195, partial [Xanthobacteraceae bacterium]|nr:hypothetical protein [Xanthobacteraceae bacterium]
ETSLLKAASHPNGIFVVPLAFDGTIFAVAPTRRSLLRAELLMVLFTGFWPALDAFTDAACDGNKIAAQAMTMLTINDITMIPDEKSSLCMTTTPVRMGPMQQDHLGRGAKIQILSLR